MKAMTFEDYQTKAKSTALYTDSTKQMLCSSIGMCTEIEEYLDAKCDENSSEELRQKELGDGLWYLATFADHMKIRSLKYLPDAGSIFDLPSACAKFLEQIKKTIRDYDYVIPEKYHDDMIEFLYNYYSVIQNEIDSMGWTIVNIMELNLAKLKDRAERNTLSGDGDER